MKTINDISCKGKKVLVRVDFNVPVNEQFEITDTTRIEAAKPTILKIVKDGGSAILLSHFGRPKGKDDKYSFSHLVKQIGQVLGVPTHFAPDCIGEVAENTAKNLPAGEVLLLENASILKKKKGMRLLLASSLSSGISMSMMPLVPHTVPMPLRLSWPNSSPRISISVTSLLKRSKVLTR